MTLGTLGAVLGGAAGHDSCCCSAVSEPRGKISLFS